MNKTAKLALAALGLATVSFATSTAGASTRQRLPAGQPAPEREIAPLLSQTQPGWEAALKLGRLVGAGQEVTALIIQLNVLQKPETTSANAIYELFARQNDQWVPIYTSTGARAIASSAQQVALEPEVIPLSQVRRGLGEKVDLANLELKAVVRVRYDLNGEERWKQLQLEALQDYDVIAQTPTAELVATGTEKPATATGTEKPATATGTEKPATATGTEKPATATGTQTPATGTGTEKPATGTGTQKPAQPATAGSSAQTIGPGEFSLAILQPSGTPSNVTVRLSLKAKQITGYLRERFIGDFRYQPSQRAKFMRGLYAGDRVVVRLYDLENRLIGLSELEILPENAAIQLILPEKPAESRVVRTVYGIDRNSDGTIDASTRTYDYFTQITGSTAGSERVTFVSNVRNINTGQFQGKGLPPSPSSSIYPPSLASGPFSALNRTADVFPSDLAPTLKAKPGELVEAVKLSNKSTSTYEVSQLMAKYREKGVSKEIQVTFADVPASHWAKDFIAELAAQEIIKGFLDGNFQPDAPVTRAEFAAMIRRAFKPILSRQAVAFKDVPASHWAFSAIRDAYEMGFFQGDTFNPDKKLDRLEVLVELARGLNYSPKGSTDTVLKVYSDAGAIPGDVRSWVAAATERSMVVNYPNRGALNPKQVATRAEVAAFLYQALATTGSVAAISSPYVVSSAGKAGEAQGQSNPRP
ncbi:S-layer homology domain-containing protein [Kamptonema formosum]|uniref:S-layer homology domain-containing protein n=1 Tax=Kamptonema formosum TaxID=331992 RepID=UPI000349102D|nr:S-layer homology domain-containing protein [Oscillatoria sp. PCC 10802]